MMFGLFVVQSNWTMLVIVDKEDNKIIIINNNNHKMLSVALQRENTISFLGTFLQD